MPENVEHRVALGHFVGRVILRLFLHIDHVLEVDHLQPDLGLMLLEQGLRVVGAVEILPRAVLCPGRAWSRPTMKWVQPWFLRISPCQTASRGPAMRMARFSSDMVVVAEGYLSSTAS